MAVAVRPARAKKGAIKCRRKFLRFFPKGFYDPKYIDWERGYKWEAHERWEATAGCDPVEHQVRVQGSDEYEE